LFARSQDPRLFRHAGRWLGALHRATETDDGTVIVFNDYNRTNIIVDEATRTVVAIDPGAYVNERVHPSQSLIMGAFSITRATLRCRQNPMRSLRYYIEGYVEGSGKTSRPPIGP